MVSETIIACGCGAQVRLPTQRGPRSFRCPVCRASIAVPIDPHITLVDAAVIPDTQRVSSEPGAICPICQTSIAADESVINCPECDQVHHNECWSEVGGCGTYGCTRAPIVEKVAPQVPTAVWGDTKQCPVCSESIKSVALRCRYCGTNFDTTDPLTLADLNSRQVRVAEQKKLKTITVVVFVLSLVGLSAPVAGLIASGYLMPRRDQLWKCGPLYSFLAWMSLVVSGVFATAIAVFAIFEWT